MSTKLRMSIVAVLATAALSSASTAQAQPVTADGRMTGPTLQRAPGRTHHEMGRLLIDESSGTAVRARPGGPILGRVSGETPLGTPSWLWAVATSSDGRWARVVLPWTPNGRTGWVTLLGRRTLRTQTWVQVDLSRRRVMLMHGATLVDSFLSAVGTPASPTPIGRFSVTDPIATGDPAGPFGWYAFGLSGHQPHLPVGWTGGDQLAIHGTNEPASLGTAASAGCLRVSATALGVLKRALRPGTPVVIHP
jgi:L,D-transpeptidase catalytic domain